MFRARRELILKPSKAPIRILILHQNYIWTAVTVHIDHSGAAILAVAGSQRMSLPQLPGKGAGRRGGIPVGAAYDFGFAISVQIAGCRSLRGKAYLHRLLLPGCGWVTRSLISKDPRMIRIHGVGYQLPFTIAVQVGEDHVVRITSAGRVQDVLLPRIVKTGAELI